jgi:hypothetical protein
MGLAGMGKRPVLFQYGSHNIPGVADVTSTIQLVKYPLCYKVTTVLCVTRLNGAATRATPRFCHASARTCGRGVGSGAADSTR